MPAVKEPRYAILASQIREQIESKVLKPGDRLLSVSEMCAHHGVTPTTVTKVYSVLQQERLIECKRGHGSFVATPPTKVLTGTVGVYGLTHSSTPRQHPFTTQLMSGLIEAGSRTDTALLLRTSNSPQDWERLDGVITHGLEGVYIMPQIPQGMPNVTIMLSIPDSVCVVADERAGIQAAVQHLVSLGHRRIAAILDPLGLPRVSAYRDALEAAGIEVDPRWLLRSWITRSVGYRPDAIYPELGLKAMQKWLREDWHELGCTAIVAQNDDTANSVIQALQEAGIDVPGEVSVTGFDGTEAKNYQRPFLTTVKMPLHEIGTTAMGLLQRQIDGETMSPITLTLPVQLEVGESTAAPRSAVTP